MGQQLEDVDQITVIGHVSEAYRLVKHGHVGGTNESTELKQRS